MGDDQIQQLRNIIKHNPALMWDTASYDTLDGEAIAEAIYNFGSWEHVKEYHRLLGIETAKGIFLHLTNKRRSNLHPKVQYFFRQYYERHVS